MRKVTQIAILGKVSGNVNADEVIGQRITLKKMYSSEGETYPFVSSRAIKYGIRQALAERGYEIDPFRPGRREIRAVDTGDPVKYVDNDLFGFMVATERGEVANRRQAPIALSYFKALKDTPLKSEVGLRTPRPNSSEGLQPLPFEVEVAEFIGRLNCLIYDYIGLDENTKEPIEGISNEERRQRLIDFLEIFLTPAFTLPRRTNSLNMPEYLCALLYLSKNGPRPIYQYLEYKTSEQGIFIDDEKLQFLLNRPEISNAGELYIVDYGNYLKSPLDGIQVANVPMMVNRIVEFMMGE